MKFVLQIALVCIFVVSLNARRVAITFYAEAEEKTTNNRDDPAMDPINALFKDKEFDFVKVKIPSDFKLNLSFIGVYIL